MKFRKRNPVYSLIKPSQNANLTRIGLGPSGLKSQRFTYNLVDNPSCDHCITANGTPLHYLLECPAYTAARQALFHDLRILLPIHILSSTNQLLSYLVNGSEDLNVAENCAILESVIYIGNTKRL